MLRLILSMLLVSTWSTVEASTPTEVRCLAENLYHEARGEGTMGMLAVGQVTLNRVKDKRWPSTVCGVVYQPKQFSWTTDKPPIRDKASWAFAKTIAAMLLNPRYSFDWTSATHYVRSDLHRRVSWTRSLQVVARIGNHVFYV